MPKLRQGYNLRTRRNRSRKPIRCRTRCAATSRTSYGALVDEGLKNLQKAVELRPDYADAMAYQSLLLRQKADMSDAAARASIEKQADDLLDKVKEIKQKAEAEKQSKS